MTKTLNERAEELIQTLVVAGDMMFHEGVDWARTRRVVELALIEQARETIEACAKVAEKHFDGWDCKNETACYREDVAASIRSLAQLQQGGKANES